VVVDAIHFDQIREHGGMHGVRDENALEATLARARQRWHYRPRSGMAVLAAAYGHGLARAHPYHDGNKRVALLAMIVFLGLNGHDLRATEPDLVRLMIGVADGRVSERSLASWIRARLVKGPLR
jgi:death-on-curing protein